MKAFAVASAMAAVLILLAPTPVDAKKPSLGEYTDEELLSELSTVSAKLNATINASNILLALRPDPAYVMTSSSSYRGNFSADMSVYTMPMGYRASMSGSWSGSSTSTYSYYDANSFARNLNGMAIAITQIVAQRRQARLQAILGEIQHRVRSRRQRVESEIRDFFAQNPELRGRGTAFASVMPWIVSQNPDLSTLRQLELAKQALLANSVSNRLEGRWHGTFAQVSTLEDGRTISFNSFVYADLVQRGNSVQGKGYLGTGDLLSIAGTVSNGRLIGTVENITSQMHTVFQADATGSQITVTFEGSGAGQEYTGRALLSR